MLQILGSRSQPGIDHRCSDCAADLAHRFWGRCQANPVSAKVETAAMRTLDIEERTQGSAVDGTRKASAIT